jgi:hypothetical protein
VLILCASNQYHDPYPESIDMTAKPSPNSAPWAWPILLAVIVFVAQALWSSPGELIADSREQLQQALSGQYSDWHPP